MILQRLAKGRVNGLFFAPDSGTLIVADAGGTIVDYTESLRCWDLGSFKETRQERVAATRFALSPDQQSVAFVTFDKAQGRPRLLVRSLDEGDVQELTPSASAELFSVFSMTFTPDGEALWTGRYDEPGGRKHWLDCYDATGKVKATRREAPGIVLALAFSPTGDRLATGGGGDDRMVRLYRTEPWSLLFELPVDASAVRRLTFSPDGALLVAAVGKVVTIWDAATGERIANLKRAKGTWVNGAAFSPDGRLLAYVYQDGEVCLWDVRVRGPHTTFTWPIGKALAIAFAPDGLTCAAGGDKGQVVVWDLDGG